LQTPQINLSGEMLFVKHLDKKIRLKI
jgi:hypothetical protein